MLLSTPARRANVQSRVVFVVTTIAIVAYLAFYLVFTDGTPKDKVLDKQEGRTLRATRDTVVDVVNQMGMRVLSLEQKLGTLETGAVRASNASEEATRTATRVDAGHEVLKGSLAIATDQLGRLTQAAARLEAKVNELDTNATRTATAVREADDNTKTDRTKVAQLESKISTLLSELQNVRNETASAVARVNELEKRFQALSDQSLAAIDFAKGRLTTHKLVRVVLVGHDEAAEAGKSGLGAHDKLFRWSAGQDSNFDVGRFGRFVVAAAIAPDKPPLTLPGQLSVFDLGPGHFYVQVDVNKIEILSRPRATGVYVLTLAVTHTD